jgi:CRISPR type I-E-associated protein CasB/Cse2
MNPHEQNQSFIARLVALCEDRGHRAALRRWWSEPTRSHALPVLGRLGALDDGRRALTAALYAIHHRDGAPAHDAGGLGLGSAARKLAGGRSDAPEFEAMERHFRRLLAADDLDDLTPRLQHLVRRLQQQGIAFDYVRLLGELRWFEKDPQSVRTHWAMAFWQAPAGEEVAL